MISLNLKANKEYKNWHLCFYVLCIVIGLAGSFLIFNLMSKGISSSPAVKVNSLKKKKLSSLSDAKIDPGWDKAGLDIYNEKLNELSNSKTTTQVINLVGEGEVTVSTIVNHNDKFWDRLDRPNPAWEPETFRIFKKYVSQETIVVDFGTWIGPTLLYHGQFSKRSYGIEADPSAFAVAKFNVDQNRHRKWGGNVFLESACVSAPYDVGKMIMKSQRPGNSMSGIGEKIATGIQNSWEVKCYTLPNILERWGVVLSEQPVMFKIDVESYECRLIPSFYEWLKDQPFLPTIFVSFHPQIVDCSDSEWTKILKVFKLYREVNAGSGTKKLSIESQTTLKDFRKMQTDLNWKRISEVVLVG